MILRGTGGEKVRVHYHNRDGRSAIFDAAFEGVLGNLERRYRETQSEYIRSKISEYMTDRPCPTCQGKRLRPEALAVTIDGRNILEVTEWPVNRSLEWAQRLGGSKISPYQTGPHHRRSNPEGNHIPTWISGGCRSGLPDPADGLPDHSREVKPSEFGWLRR